MRTIHTSIEIAAPPAEVWRVLTDTAAYPEWNPFIRSFEGDLRVGARLRVHIQPPDARGMTLRPKLLAFSPSSELRWRGRLGLPRIFDGEHRFELEAIDGGHGTRFVQAERFRGLLVPLVGSLLRNTERGFVAMNEALAVRVRAARGVSR